MSTTRRAALAAFASLGAGAAIPKALAARSVSTDPLPALYAEKVRLIALINEGQHATEAATDALMDAWGACDNQAIATPATTTAGAIASIQWAREELLEFGFAVDPVPDDRGVRIVLSLLDGALGALRRNGGAA
jgi:hypothetical protein